MPHVTRIVIAVINLKGGTGKTTTAAFIGHALSERGLRVVYFDADKQASLQAWGAAAEWAAPVIGKASSSLHRELDGIVGDRFDVVIIDTPPTEHDRGIALSAARAATHCIVPVAPTPAEYQRMPALAELFADATDLRPDGQPPEVAALLVRTVAGASSTDVYRRALTADGWPVLSSHVPRWERYAQALGEPVLNAGKTSYGHAVEQLLDLPMVVTA